MSLSIHKPYAGELKSQKFVRATFSLCVASLYFLAKYYSPLVSMGTSRRTQHSISDMVEDKILNNKEILSRQHESLKRIMRQAIIAQKGWKSGSAVNNARISSMMNIINRFTQRTDASDDAAAVAELQAKLTAAAGAINHALKAGAEQGSCKDSCSQFNDDDDCCSKNCRRF